MPTTFTFVSMVIQDGIEPVNGVGLFFNQHVLASTSNRLGLPNRWHGRLMLAIALIVLSALLLVYFRMVFLAPTRTPLLVISSTYEPPWDINPWENENVDAIESLHRHNLTVKKLNDPNSLTKGQWSDFEDAIANLVYGIDRDKPLLLYVNLHGIVGGDSQPYFLVRDSIPLDSSTWIPVQRLLDHVANVTRGSRPIVMFLESGRQTSVLPKERPDHVFAASIRRIVESHSDHSKLQGLSIFVSTTTNAGSANPADRQADPFTLFVSQGLGGLCDQKRLGGNGNQSVEIEELNSYIQRCTKEFALSNRGFLQTSTVYTTPITRQAIAWAGNPTQPPTSNYSQEPPSQQLSQIADAWRSIAKLKTSAPWHSQPAEWSQLIGTAVAMEEAAFGGHSAVSRFDDLARDFHELTNSLQLPNPSSPAVLLATSDLDLRISAQSQEIWKQIAAVPKLETIVRVLKPASMVQGIADVPPIPFLLEAVQYPSLSLWSQTDSLSQFARAQSKLESIRLQTADFPRIKSLWDRLHSVDVYRRTIEDRVLASQKPTSETNSLLTEIQSYERQVTELDQWAKRYRQAMSDHELALSELPGLYRPLDAIEATRSSNSPSELVATTDRLVNGLLDNARVLRNSLQMEAAFSKGMPNVGNDMTRLRQLLTQQWTEMLGRSETLSPAQNFVIQELLRSGFLPNESNSIDMAIDMRIASRKCVSRYGSKANERMDSPTDKTLDTPHRNQRLMANLILALSNLESDSTDRDAPAKTTCLHELGSSVCKTLGSDIDHSESYRFAAMSVARAMAPLCMDTDCTGVVNDWNGRATRHRVIRSGLRIADDFWKSPTFKSKPYFYNIASDLFESAASDYSGSIQDQVEVAFQQLNSRLVACERSVHLVAEHLPNWRAGSDIESQCDLTLGPASDGLPECIGSIAIESRDKESTPATWVNRGTAVVVSIGPGMQPGSFRLSTPKLSDLQITSNRHSKAVLRFRGHAFQSEFELFPSHDNYSIARVDTPAVAKVEIIDRKRKHRARTLILDCSASMIGNYRNETNIEDSVDALGKSKMSAAKLAVNDILARWRNSQDLVAVHFFGHRIAQGTLEQGTLLQNRYVNAYPVSQSIRPFDDTEIALSLGRFSDSEYSSIRRRLELIIPWGQTPLYLAIQHAIDEGTQLAPGTQHDIIVISDGRNYQFNPTPETNLSIDSVIEKAKESGVHIHIVGFGVPDAEIAEATSQFQRLAMETGGTAAIQASDAIELIDRVDRIVKPDSFEIELATGEKWTQESTQPFAFPVPLRANTPAWIHYRNQHQLVPVSPGATIRLMVGSNNRLVSLSDVPERESASVSILNSNKLPSPFQLAVYSPKSANGAMQWNLALRREDGEVPQRPTYVWAELEPLSLNSVASHLQPSDMDHAYVVADGCWRGEMPVPVLSFETKRWPQNVERARLQYWCTDIKPELLATISIPKTNVGDGLDSPVAVNLKDIGIRYQIHFENEEIVLVLLHTRTDEVLNYLPKLLGCEVIQIDRQYSRSRRMSVHRFKTTGISTMPQAFELLSSQDIKRKGLQLAQPVEIPILPEIATLPSSPPYQFRR